VLERVVGLSGFALFAGCLVWITYCHEMGHMAGNWAVYGSIAGMVIMFMGLT
jgi:hypothetical protein